MHVFARSERGVHAASMDDAAAQIAASTGRRPADAAPVRADHFVWVDIAGPGEPEMALLRDRFGFHPLAVEDCLRGRQRPKLERYPGHYFLVVYAARINPDRDRVAFNELHMFIGEDFIVTVHDHRIAEVRETQARWRANPAHFNSVAAVAHAVLDGIIDDYFPIVDHFVDRVGDAETRILDLREEDAIHEIYALRRQLILFRRVVSPERDIIARLLRRDLPFLSPELVPYFQDVRDHAIRITEEIDTLRDLVGTILEGHASEASNQLNQTMRRLTSWSIILMSMNLVASNYGMNFDFMPELALRFGYPLALLAMLVVGMTLAMYFNRKHWL